ncbi:MAG: YdcF family protein [Cloacibacillus sp.]
MLFFFYKLIGSLIVPPGLFILILLGLSITARRKPRRPKLSAALALFAILLYFMSTSIGSRTITGPPEALYSRKLPSKDIPAAVIVLAGGSSYDDKGSSVQPGLYSLERIYSAVNLMSERENSGDILILSGGNVFGANDRSEAAALRDAAEKMGFAGRAILEEQSRTTAENIQYCAKILQEEDINRAIIVTNAFHIPRAMRLAEKHMPYIPAYPYPSGRLTDPVLRGYSSFLPNCGEANASCLGIKEWIGIVTGKITGHIKR